MSNTLTLSLIKPDAVERGLVSCINSMILEHDLHILVSIPILLTKAQAEEFYYEHSDRAFFPDLIKCMTSGEIYVQILRGESAIEKYRNLMGATNPSDANLKTIRKRYGINIEKNSVHGSDSDDSAKRELKFFYDLIGITDTLNQSSIFCDALNLNA